MYELLFGGVLFGYFFGTLMFIAGFAFRSEPALNRALFLALFGFLAHTAALAVRWLAAGFAPVSSFYESLSFFSWAVTAVFLFLVLRRRLLPAGAFIMPPALVLAGYAALMDSSVKPLLPVLRSRWLFVHVAACFLGYACFAGAFSLGIMYLMQERQVKRKRLGRLFERLPSLETLDDLGRRFVLAGFILLTWGIITGAVWAQQAWGRWWGWDPKETAALLTWLVYAIYLHARINSGWQGRKTAILSIAGFAAVLFTYLGVSFLLPGLHSYL